jgi:hypothetical protein
LLIFAQAAESSSLLIVVRPVYSVPIWYSYSIHYGYTPVKYQFNIGIDIGTHL